jgi:hypothetical protein
MLDFWEVHGYVVVSGVLSPTETQRSVALRKETVPIVITFPIRRRVVVLDRLVACSEQVMHIGIGGHRVADPFPSFPMTSSHTAPCG